MTLKPQSMAGYSHGRTALAERGLLEVWRHLGTFRKHMVLVGGLVPRYLVGCPRHRGQLRHCGSLDVDLGVRERTSDAFAHALQSFVKRFKTPTSDGCDKYARFIGTELQANRIAAYAAVQEFLKEAQYGIS